MSDESSLIPDSFQGHWRLISGEKASGRIFSYPSIWRITADRLVTLDITLSRSPSRFGLNR
jgi:hypothetical protein